MCLSQTELLRHKGGGFANKCSSVWEVVMMLDLTLQK